METLANICGFGAVVVVLYLVVFNPNKKQPMARYNTPRHVSAKKWPSHGDYFL